MVTKLPLATSQRVCSKDITKKERLSVILSKWKGVFIHDSQQNLPSRQYGLQSTFLFLLFCILSLWTYYVVSFYFSASVSISGFLLMVNEKTQSFFFVQSLWFHAFLTLSSSFITQKAQKGHLQELKDLKQRKGAAKVAQVSFFIHLQ